MTSCNKQMIKSYASGSKQLCNIQMQKMSQFFFAIKILKINIKNESIKVGYFLNVCNWIKPKEMLKTIDKHVFKNIFINIIKQRNCTWCIENFNNSMETT